MLIAQVLFPTAPPGVGRADAFARASGNRRAVAVRIGQALFKNEWAAQVLNVYADGFDGHEVAGLRLSGTHFHHALSRDEFMSEVTDLLGRSFAASKVEEIDIWATVPLRVGKDVVVSGDLAVPTWRTVFSLSARRDESTAELLRRMRQGGGVFWDQEWERSALK